MPPRTISCEVCGKQFFKRSYPIHLKQCRAKRQQSYSKCAKCGLPVSNDEYSDHFLNCEHSKPAKTKPKKIRNEEKHCRSAPDLSKERTKDDMGRLQCISCDRFFSSDRIAKHETICLNNAKRKKRKKYPSASRTRMKGTVFEKFTRRMPLEVAHTRNWREEHRKVRNGIEFGLLIAEFQKKKIPLSQLPPCNVGGLASLNDIELNPQIKEIINGVLNSRKRSAYFDTNAASQFTIGEKILLKGRESQARIEYIGRIPELFKGYWLGVILDEGVGCNNGAIHGRQYFQCTNSRGLFIRPSNAIKLSRIITRASRKESTPKQENEIFVKRKPLSARFRKSIKIQQESCDQRENINIYAN